MRHLFLVAGGLFVSAFLAGCSGEAQRDGAVNEDAPEEKRWFVSAANPHAAEAGAEILRRGGSAADAAVAVQAVLSLVEPQSSGLAGGAFMLHYDPVNGEFEVYNGREVAPASATPDRFLKEDGAPMGFYDAVAGGLSVGVPGVVRMLEEAHSDHGELPWSELFTSAIDLSENGFEISPRLNSLLNRIPRLKQLPEAAAYFYGEDGAPHPVGHVLKNPAYAETLGALAEGGADAFYTGAIADAIVEAVNNAPNPGGMTLTDLENYEIERMAPICANYNAYEVCTMGPPSSGVTLLQILTILDEFDLASAGAFSVEALHLFFEASRLAYADRAEFVGDARVLAADGGLTYDALSDGLLSENYLKARAALISMESAAESVSAGDPSAYVASGDASWSGYAPDTSPEGDSTSHFTIVDAEGRVVSMTTTVEFVFGSHLMAGGMILNNQLTDFSFQPEHEGVPVANAVAAGKRPRSSMTPVIIFDENGEFYAALGSPGGPAIIGYVAKTLIAMMEWGMTLEEAVNAPNVAYPRGSGVVEEEVIDDQIIAGLKAKGHDLSVRALNSGIHAVRLGEDGEFEGAADPRREGIWLTGVVESGVASPSD